jgi:hypothetical protein
MISVINIEQNNNKDIDNITSIHPLQLKKFN